nr:hypothetical protein [Tanacetum cinerariifolium]
MDTCTTLTRRVEQLEQDKVAKALEITKLKSRVKKLEKRNNASKLKRLKNVGSAQRIDTSDDTVMDDVSNQERMIADIDANTDVVLEEAKDVAADIVKDVQDADIEDKPAELQEVVDVVTTAKIITEVVTAASTTITAADVPIPAAITVAASTLTAAPSRRRKGVVIRDPKETTTTSIITYPKAKSKDKGKGILVEEPKPLKKQAQIEQDEKYARELVAELNKNIDWDEVIDHVKRKNKEDNAVMIYQALKRKPQTKAQARKNMMLYLKNVAGLKMDYFKGMTYDDIRPIFEKHFDSNVAFLQKTKEQMDEEDSRALKRLNESQEEKVAKRQKLDEEFILLVERRYPLTRFTLDQMLNNVRLEVEEESEVSLELLREDLEVLWQLVKERVATAKPNNFYDDFLLITLGAMFEKPDIHAQIWKNQRSVHGQAKVKSWKLLESCEEESEVSLELLRFIRQQHQEGAQLE